VNIRIQVVLNSNVEVKQHPFFLEDKVVRIIFELGQKPYGNHE
jgi:hypothetical protein